MKKLLAGFAVLPFLAGVALAGNPTSLSDAQMDKITAGVEYNFIGPGAQGVEIVVGVWPECNSTGCGGSFIVQYNAADPHVLCAAGCTTPTYEPAAATTDFDIHYSPVLAPIHLLTTGG